MSNTLKDIKDIKIQGAINVAKAALKDLNAYGTDLKFTTRSKYLKDIDSRSSLIKKTRSTEPAMHNVLDNVLTSLKKTEDKEELKLRKRLYDFCKAELTMLISCQNLITQNAAEILPKNPKILIHCHSNTVIDIIKNLDNPKVISTETRPRMQGRLSAKDLTDAGIDTTEIVDDAIADVIDSVDFVLVGSDAITKDGIINKIGTRTIAEIASLHKKPFYVAAGTIKTIKKIPIEIRSSDEIWDKKPKSLKIKNFAFDLTPWKYITGGIITEKGLKKKQDFKL